MQAMLLGSADPAAADRRRRRSRAAGAGRRPRPQPPPAAPAQRRAGARGAAGAARRAPGDAARDERLRRAHRGARSRARRHPRRKRDADHGGSPEQHGRSGDARPAQGEQPRERTGAPAARERRGRRLGHVLRAGPRLHPRPRATMASLAPACSATPAISTRTRSTTTYTDSFGRVAAARRHPQRHPAPEGQLELQGLAVRPRFPLLFLLLDHQRADGRRRPGRPRRLFPVPLLRRCSTVTAGIMPLPTTRSTNYTFPNWLRNDNRVMADEFFRGSYSTGIDAQGEIAPRAALPRRDRQQPRPARRQLAGARRRASTPSPAPCGGCRRPASSATPSGFGDYDNHQEVATLVGVHYTRSRETAQGQPEIDDFENSQIRLSDGTLLFSPDPFGTGGKIEEATYQMVGDQRRRQISRLLARGRILFPLGRRSSTDRHDPGRPSSTTTASRCRPRPCSIPHMLQAYATYSQIFGEYGDPTEFALGAQHLPVPAARGALELQALRLDHSPVGGCRCRWWSAATAGSSPATGSSPSEGARA